MVENRDVLKYGLLVIDAQESFMARGETFWKSRGPQNFEKNITDLVSGFRKTGHPIFFILHQDNDPGFSQDSPYFRVMGYLDKKPDEPLLIKSVHNAFTSTDLLPRLVKEKIHHLVICGIRTEQCCETTTRVASDLGFDVDFVTEATLTFPLIHPSTKETMNVEQIQTRTEMVLHGRFARISTVKDVLSRL